MGGAQNPKTTYQIKYTDEVYNDISYNEFLTYVIRTDLPVKEDGSGYDVVIRVYGNSTNNNLGNIGLLTSDFSAPVSIKYVEDTKGLSVDNGVVSWTKVPKAYAYKVHKFSKHLWRWL